MAQPCALTTRVSQTSEKRVPGSRLVTRTGRLIGTLELRRSAAGELVLCIITALTRGVRDTVLRGIPVATNLPPTGLPASVSGVLCRFAERPMGSRSLVTE